MKNKVVLLTTTDNPFDPIKQPDEWYMYDTTILKYNCCGILDRNLPLIFDTLTPKVQTKVMEETIDEIIKKYPLFPFKKIVTEVEEKYSDPDFGVLELLDEF